MPIQKIYDLSDLQWRVSGCIPYQWEIAKNTETGIGTQDDFEISSVPARVPGSVQKALLDAGHIPDWNKGLNARSCEWVENRHWIYETVLPDEWIDSEHKFHLKCLGLDYRGRIMLNGREVGGFDNVFVPWEYDLTPFLKEADNTLRIIFELSPRWLGQIYFTSRIKDWKERFNYHWDWTSRLVQIGIWDSVYLVNINEGRINTLKCTTDVNAASKKGLLNIKVGANIEKNGGVRISLEGAEGVIREERLRLRDASEIELLWDDLPIQLWWPNGLGDQILYSLKCELFDPQGNGFIFINQVTEAGQHDYRQ
jgi:beta-mannosidase